MKEKLMKLGWDSIYLGLICQAVLFSFGYLVGSILEWLNIPIMSVGSLIVYPLSFLFGTISMGFFFSYLIKK